MSEVMLNSGITINRGSMFDNKEYPKILEVTKQYLPFVFPDGYWIKYNGDYEKDHYHIKLFSGQIIYNCYPNASKWTCIDNQKQVFDNSEVEYIHKFTEVDWNNFIWKD